MPDPMLTTLARCWSHRAERDCADPGPTRQTAWRRAHGASGDTTDRGLAELRCAAAQTSAHTEVVEGWCSHVELVVVRAMTTALARGRAEREALARDAAERASWSPRMAVVCGAVSATLSWLDGDRRLAPATGAPRVPDAAGVAAEESEARDAESLARGALGDGTWAGVVAHTLAWCREAADTERPLL